MIEVVTPKDYYNEVKSLIYKNQSFLKKHTHTNDIGLVPNVEVQIPTCDEHPPAYRYIRLLLLERPHMDEKIKELLKADVIIEGRSPYASPALLIKKCDGSRRLVINFRQINKSVITNPRTLPHIDELICCLNGSKFYSILE